MDNILRNFPMVAKLEDGNNQVKLRACGRLNPGVLVKDGDYIELKYGFNRALTDEVKMFEGRKYHGFDNNNPRKTWGFRLTQRNIFALEYMLNGNPYERYQLPVKEYITPFDRGKDFKLGKHQAEAIGAALVRKRMLWAYDMGLGKSLSAIELIDYINKYVEKLTPEDVFFVSCRSGLVSVEAEIERWGISVRPQMMTYEGLTSLVSKKWDAGRAAPKIVIYDESSLIKTPSAQRSQAAMALADAVREEHDGYVICMTGTPAPRSPENWWNQCETVCPGFLREPSVPVFKSRFCLQEMRESLSGGTYPHLITYLDDERKCAICGDPVEAPQHDLKSALADGISIERTHTFKPSVNEVNKLYHRMKGLVEIRFKSDVLDLPEMVFQQRKVKPTPEIIRAFQLIKQTAKRAITALTLCREISDGFQYVDEKIGSHVCPDCNGTGDNPNQATECQSEDGEEYGIIGTTCLRCGGSGMVDDYQRGVDHVGTPKDDALVDLLEEYADIGRFVTWCGYTASIDHVVELVRKRGWFVLRVDGRGYAGFAPDGTPVSSDDLLEAMRRGSARFDLLSQQYPKVCFVGNPQAGGMGLTLHASPVAVYYSNTFDGGARIQSEARIHRMGMDANRGALIIDLIMLPTDLLVLNNLKKKKRLQSLTMGEIQDVKGLG